MEFATVRFYLDSKVSLPKLLSVREASQLTGVSEKRLFELANAEIAPCVRIDGGEPRFFKHDIMAWVKAHLLKLQEGKSLTKPFIVHATEEVAELASVPHELLSMADHLYRFSDFGMSGVYFLVKNRKVVYVGQSVNIAGRMIEHVKTKDFDSVFYLKVPNSELDEVEGAFIRALDPVLNGGRGPVSPKPERVFKKYSFEIKESHKGASSD